MTVGNTASLPVYESSMNSYGEVDLVLTDYGPEYQTIAMGSLLCRATGIVLNVLQPIGIFRTEADHDGPRTDFWSDMYDVLVYEMRQRGCSGKCDYDYYDVDGDRLTCTIDIREDGVYLIQVD